MTLKIKKRIRLQKDVIMVELYKTAEQRLN